MTTNTKIDHILETAAGLQAGDSDSAVERSWHRSASAYGIDPISAQQPTILTDSDIHDLRQPLDRMLAVAQPELDSLYAAVRGANYVVLLCDKNGVVIDHRGEEREADQFRHWGTWLGGVWTEAIEGTNGIGTCIAEGRAVNVHQSDHFRARHHSLSCSGAPILAANGTLLGVVDLSSIDPQLSEHAHALAGSLVVRAARSIEERLFRDAHRKHWIVVTRTAGVPTSTIMIAVDGDGMIVAGNAGFEKRYGKQADRKDLNFWALFKRSPDLFHGRNREDVRTLLRPIGIDEQWRAIVTRPIHAPGRLTSSVRDDFNLCPRRDSLLGERWQPSLSVQVGGLSPATLRRIEDFVEARLETEIGLDTLAGEAGLSTAHFARSFRQSVGKTPHVFILERRLARANEMLRRPGLSLAEIAQVTGFADQSHFTRRFREAFGISPGEFRRQQRSG